MTDKDNNKGGFDRKANPDRKSILEPDKPAADNLDQEGDIAYIPIEDDNTDAIPSIN